MKKVLFAVLLLAACKERVMPEMGFDKVPVDAGDVSGEGEGEGEQVSLSSEACDDLRILLCAKVATCSNVLYGKCVVEYDAERKCEQANQTKVEQCFQEFADVKCSQDLPASCLEL